MGIINYSSEAGLFSAKGTNFRQKGLEYRRFAQAAEAIRFAIEVLPANALDGCALEVDDERIVGRAIRGLYESVEFPLPRQSRFSNGSCDLRRRDRHRVARTGVWPREAVRRDPGLDEHDSE